MNVSFMVKSILVYYAKNNVSSSKPIIMYYCAPLVKTVMYFQHDSSTNLFYSVFLNKT